MTIDSRRGPAIIALLALLVGGLILAIAPLHAGEVRLAGVSLLWWYVALIAPLAASGITIVGLVRLTR